MSQAGAKYKKEFVIYKHKNPEYVLFLEDSKIKSYFRNEYISHIENAFKEKRIILIILKNLSDETKYQCSNADPTKKRCVHYDDLKYPSFGKMYILFDTNNFENENIIKYYTIDRYLFQMKSYVHNFLIFLAQSFGADTIKWSCVSQNSTHDSREVGIKAGSQGATIGSGGGSSKDKEAVMSSDLVLKYDNNGSEIFFETTTNELPWCIKIQKIIKDSIVPYDIIKYWRNDNVMEKFLEDNRYFRYEFYKNNEFLVDFIRKRQNGMNSIHHEVVFYDNHRTIVNYYADLGVTYLGNFGLNFSRETSTASYNTTLYNVTFYNTFELEKKTLQTSIIEDKSISQLKDENKQTIKKIRKRQSDWENCPKYKMECDKYKYEYYKMIKTQREAREQQNMLMNNQSNELTNNTSKSPLRKRSSIAVLGAGSSENVDTEKHIDNKNIIQRLPRLDEDQYETVPIVSPPKSSLCCAPWKRLRPREYKMNIMLQEDYLSMNEDTDSENNSNNSDNLLEKSKSNKYNDAIEYNRNIDNKHYNLIIILQKYNRYFNILEDDMKEKIILLNSSAIQNTTPSDNVNDENVDDEKKRQRIIEEYIRVQKIENERKRQEKLSGQIKQKKITFIKDLLRCFYTLVGDQIHIYGNKSYRERWSARFKMDTYLEKTPDEFLYYMIDHILSSIDMEKAIIEYIYDIRILTRSVNPPNDEKDDILNNDEKPLDPLIALTFILESSYYKELNPDGNLKKDIDTNILPKMPNYNKYEILCLEKEQKKQDQEYKNVKFIRLANKPNGSNYASCDGYYKSHTKIVNGVPAFFNERKSRFIGKSGDGWIITGTQWLDAISEESENKVDHYFGGFHAATNSSKTIVTSSWKDYEVLIVTEEEYQLDRSQYTNTNNDEDSDADNKSTE